MTDKERAIEFLDWYLHSNDGTTDCAVQCYDALKQYIKQIEKAADKFYKINMYLLRKYKQDLMKDYECKTEFDEYFTLIKIFDGIAAKMDEEMPEPWYAYGFGGKKDV